MHSYSSRPTGQIRTQRNRAAFLETIDPPHRAVIVRWFREAAETTTFAASVLFIIRNKARMALTPAKNLFDVKDREAGRALLAALDADRGRGLSIAAASEFLDRKHAQIGKEGVR